MTNNKSLPLTVAIKRLIKEERDEICSLNEKYKNRTNCRTLSFRTLS